MWGYFRWAIWRTPLGGVSGPREQLCNRWGKLTPSRVSSKDNDVKEEKRHEEAGRFRKQPGDQWQESQGRGPEDRVGRGQGHAAPRNNA